MGLGLGVVKLGSKSRDLARRVVFALVVVLVEITKTAKKQRKIDWAFNIITNVDDDIHFHLSRRPPLITYYFPKFYHVFKYTCVLSILPQLDKLLTYSHRHDE